MASISHYLLILVFLDLHTILLAYLLGCTCSEESFGRTLQCRSVSLGKISTHFSEEFKQVRIENSPIYELSKGSFMNMSTLECLWLNFSNVTVIHKGALDHLSGLRELRLEGNRLHSIPWTTFQVTPLLRVLDLKNNRIEVLPELALQFLVSLTYLDLSSNRLTVVSRRVFLNWVVHQKLQPDCRADILSSKMLALHNNPWLCDCRLRGLVQFVRSVSLPVILVNPYLVCQGPLSKAGQCFYDMEPGACVKPEISTPRANVTIQVGQNVTLSCLARASPSATIVWTYPLSMWKEFDVLTSITAEDDTLSELIIPAAHLVYRGNYTCVASNPIGRSSLVISLHIHPTQALPGSHSLPSPSEGEAYLELKIVKQTVRGVLLEWFAEADTPEKWFTLYIISDEALKQEAVHIGPGINMYLVDGLLPSMKYRACLSLGARPALQGRCVVFVTGSDAGRELEERERFLHVTVVLCAILLTVPLGVYVWAAQAPLSCKEWGLGFCSGGRTPRCPQAAPLHQEDFCKDHVAACEDGLGHRDTEVEEEAGKGVNG
ncbi:leucine-rich repeat, immunoglobulin-like domain and transmembrane domain-containing protein 2 [Erinaceus europaeus]|uniref:leucine-rich repeat, immunoglobulin-like domain and transmembrane domain-containing protein 2 n=1 Tax=Erinaceus europaeus TaxID=9365 RepID=UPI0000F63544|nr:leucine-rich repeat, immunoglobulin-like domain and transmembrane domain-containing protein 2 [Erinaceus europaeus]